MTNKSKAILLVVGALGFTALGASLGRYTSKTESHSTKTTVQDKTTETDKHVETTTTETVKPDGTKTTMTQTVEDTKKHRDSTSTVATNRDKTVEVSHGSDSKVTISALAGTSLTSFGTPVYGASVTKPILGPLTVGVWYLSPAIVGMSAGLTF